MTRPLLAVGAAALVALVAAGVAWAADPGKEKIAFTAAGQAQAKREVLRRADLGKGWSGGSRKPDLSSSMPCSAYRPKQSDLVVTGAAETTWQAQGFQVDSVAQVLRTAAMVRLDWQRTILAPQVLPCLRQGFASSVGSSGKLVSFGRAGFPGVARYTRAFRAVFDVKTGTGTVPVEIDFVALAAARNEVTLTMTGPAAQRSVLHDAEVRMARALAGRMRAG